MNVFLTGGTGYIGSAVAASLREHRHDVTALVRADSNQGRLRDLGCAIVEGDLQSLGELTAVLREHDTIIHTARGSKDPAGDDSAALDAFLSLSDQEHYVIYTTGVWVFGDTGGESVDEDSPVKPLPISAWRPAFEQRVLSAGGERFSTSVMRPGCVYGRSQSLLRDWFRAAAAGEPVKVVGDGANRWALVHLDDLADLYVKMAESRYRGMAHATDDTKATLQECAAAVAQSGGAGSVVENVPLDSARETFGPMFTEALAVNQRVSSAKTREQSGWTPRREFISSLTEQWDEWKRATR